jgi:hypothetical protein
LIDDPGGHAPHCEKQGSGQTPGICTCSSTIAHFTLETAPHAHRRLDPGKAQGKVVIDITADQGP